MLQADKYPAQPSLTLSLNWKVTLLSVLLLPLLLRLGYWQLERGEEKQQLQDQINVALSLPRVLLDGFEPEPPLLRKVTLQGHFESAKYWLLANQVRNARVGYEVIVPYRLESGVLVLVNRGWVQAPATRDKLPEVVFSPSNELRGRLYLPSENAMVRNLEKQVGWPKRIQKLLPEQATEQLGEPVYSAILRIAYDDPSALVTQWRWLNSTQDKHNGYAFQWFAMAFALCVTWLFSNSNLGVFLKSKCSDNNKRVG